MQQRYVEVTKKKKKTSKNTCLKSKRKRIRKIKVVYKANYSHKLIKTLFQLKNIPMKSFTESKDKNS